MTKYYHVYVKKITTWDISLEIFTLLKYSSTFAVFVFVSKLELTNYQIISENNTK